MTEKNIEEKLMELIEENFEGVNRTKPFEGYLCTRDRGVVVDMEDGSQILLTIQGFTPTGRRME